MDRLLASPRYGERWGRHWLDVARYADTKGYLGGNEERRFAYSYTYRDWVIRALNEDLPYDQFITEQIAADHVAPKDDARPLAAMGFLTLGRRFLNNPHDIIDDRIDVLCRGLMSFTVGCARCHDHKFDPIPQKDYYALYGVFASSIEPKELPLLPDSRDAATAADYEGKRSEKQAAADAFLERKQLHRNWLITLSLRTPIFLPPENVERSFDRAERDELTALRAKVDALNASPGSPPRAMSMADAPQPTKPRVFIRGNPARQGDEVPRRFLTVLSGGAPQPFPEKTSGRLELARAIASKDNPLTARSIVNRVWMHHFGKGIVRTPGDFGVKGEPPTHPELLDFLAAAFTASETGDAAAQPALGWSLKKLHRLILLSSTYQQGSDANAKALQGDPENRLLSRMNRRRLDFEAMRDSLLFAAGQLDFTPGGRSVELTVAPFAKRRAVYGYVDRQNLPGIFRTFDFASPDATNPQRYSTSVPQQALFMLNNPFVVEQARSLVGKPEFAPANTPGEAQVQALYSQIYARPAESAEVGAALHFLQSQNEQRNERLGEWQNGFGSYDEVAHEVRFSPLPHWTGKEWQGGPKLPDAAVGWTVLRAEGGHPGDAQHAVIRRWTAPEDATIAITGALARPGEKGDGVGGLIVSSRTGELLRVTAEPRGTVETKLDHVEVKRGDTLDFIVTSRADTESDSFTWSPQIDSGGATWNAQTAFSGPRPAPLTAWEKYAQVLLAGNEFVFVD